MQNMRTGLQNSRPVCHYKCCFGCIGHHRGCVSDLPPDMLKPAANQAFGSKSSFWQQMKNEKVKIHQKLFSEDGLDFWRQKIPQKNSWRQITFCRKQRFQHVSQQITDTPSDGEVLGYLN